MGQGTPNVQRVELLLYFNTSQSHRLLFQGILRVGLDQQAAVHWQAGWAPQGRESSAESTACGREGPGAGGHRSGRVQFGRLAARNYQTFSNLHHPAQSPSDPAYLG